MVIHATGFASSTTIRTLAFTSGGTMTRPSRNWGRSTVQCPTEGAVERWSAAVDHETPSLRLGNWSGDSSRRSFQRTHIFHPRVRLTRATHHWPRSYPPGPPQRPLPSGWRGRTSPSYRGALRQPAHTGIGCVASDGHV